MLNNPDIPIVTVTRAADLPRWFITAQPTAEDAAARYEKALGRKPAKIYELRNRTNHWYTVDLEEEGLF